MQPDVMSSRSVQRGVMGARTAALEAEAVGAEALRIVAEAVA